MAARGCSCRWRRRRAGGTGDNIARTPPHTCWVSTIIVYLRISRAWRRWQFVAEGARALRALSAAYRALQTPRARAHHILFACSASCHFSQCRGSPRHAAPSTAYAALQPFLQPRQAHLHLHVACGALPRVATLWFSVRSSRTVVGATYLPNTTPSAACTPLGARTTTAPTPAVGNELLATTSGTACRSLDNTPFPLPLRRAHTHSLHCRPDKP